MTATRPTGLVVDDNAINRNLVAHMMRKLGWDAVVVDSGDAALEVLRARAVDMVLLDLRMPGMGGEEACRRIRTELGLPDLKVVAYTAHGMPEEKSRMLAAGFDNLLIKPISFADVRELLGRIAPGPA